MNIALFIHGSHRLLPDVVRLAERLGRVYVLDCDNGAFEGEAADVRANLVMNFLTRIVFRGAVLDRPNVNFHPGCPRYPGIGATSRALYDSVETFGATAHGMVRRVDTGPIFAVERIPVLTTDTSETLFARAEIACLALVDRVTDHLVRTGDLPASDEQWTGPYVGVAGFQNWLRMDPADPDDMARKIRAARHSTKAGPYIEINGHRFVLAKAGGHR